MTAVISPQASLVDLLPSYAQARIENVTYASRPDLQEKEHIYHLTKNGKQWLTLSFCSQKRDSDGIPVFNQRSPISGTVKLDLAGEAVIRSVSVSVSGNLC